MTQTRYTPEQQSVIEHEGKHAVVSAVAGSGKTETLIGRIRYLMLRHAPEQVAVVMFNKEAAASFRRRLAQAVPGRLPEVRTFNSMGEKILRRMVELGHIPHATLKTHDHLRAKMARAALAADYKATNGEDSVPSKDLVDGFVAFLGLVKCDTCSAEEVYARGRYTVAAMGFPRAFAAYEEMRLREGLRFFEDQLFDPVKLLLRKPGLQSIIADRVDHLIVDEAQDMNGIQIALIKMLAGSRAKVMIVGDEDQAIYSWRGAQPEYIVRGFEADFRGATRYTLPHTFRFGHTLSLAASHVIANNRRRTPKISISAPSTPQTTITSIATTVAEPSCARRIQEELQGGRSPDDIAVLVRVYAMSVPLEIGLIRLGVPYFVYGRQPLVRIPEIATLISVLKLAAGDWKTADRETVQFMLHSMLTTPTLYLTTPVLDGLVEQAADRPLEICRIVRSAIHRETPPYQAQQLRDRADLLEIIAASSNDTPTGVMDLYLRGTDFERSVRRQTATVERVDGILQNVAAFRDLAARHKGTIEQFLEELDPLIDAADSEPPTEPHVRITSIHKSKGEQWPVVFVPGLANGAFPSTLAEADDDEAERRLFYVAMTRAIERLYLVHPEDPALTKHLDNIDDVVDREPGSPTSPFLWEMHLATARHAGEALHAKGPFTSKDVDLPDIANGYFGRFAWSSSWRFGKRVRPTPPKADATVDAGNRLPKGAVVEHATFGIGIVDEWLDQRVVRIRFDNGDTRLLVAELARLQPVNR